MFQPRVHPLIVRPLDWALDSAAVHRFDTSYVTDRIYALRRSALAFSLIEERLDSPLRRSHAVTLNQDAIAASLIALAAFDRGELLGIAAVKAETWNRRAVVTDFYVSPLARRTGVGKRLIKEILAQLAPSDLRQLWVETQSVNFPAVTFYREQGFEFSGLDTTLYDAPHERDVALYFSRPLR